jgi:phosphoglycolate phosphatase
LESKHDSKIRHIIFDFDGTIVDSLGIAIQLFNPIAHKYNLKPLNNEDLDKLRRMPILERFKATNISPYQIPRIGLEFTRNYTKSLGSIQVFAGMREVILNLKEHGLVLSIISSNSNHNIRKLLRVNDLNVFDNIYCAKNLFGKEKTIDNLIKKLRLRRQELIYVGDEIRDIIACQANDIRVIAVTWGFDTEEMLGNAQPNYIARKPADISDIIYGLMLVVPLDA